MLMVEKKLDTATGFEENRILEELAMSLLNDGNVLCVCVCVHTCTLAVLYMYTLLL